MRRGIVVAGTPGVGKTVLSRGLAEKLGFRHLDLGEMVRSKGLHSGFDRRRGSYVVNERLVRSAIRRVAGEGFVFSTHFLGSLLPAGAVHACLVLRLDPVVLFRRLRGRGWSSAKSWENVESELIDLSYFDAVKALGRGKVSEIDTTGKSKAGVFREALSILSRHRGGPRQRVDWLSVYDPVVLARRFGVE